MDSVNFELRTLGALEVGPMLGRARQPSPSSPQMCEESEGPRLDHFTLPPPLPAAGGMGMGLRR